MLKTGLIDNHITFTRLIEHLATPVSSAGATGQADPHRLTLTKKATITELPLKNNVCYAAPQA